MAEVIKVPVLIVGGGGCGLIASSMLSNMGIKHVLVESHPGTTLLPKAHLLNQRTVEILAQHDLWQKVKEQACSPEDIKTFRYATSFGGDGPLDAITLGRVSIFGCNSQDPSCNDYETYTRDSAYLTTNLPLIRLEPILRSEAEARNPDADGILFNHAAVAFKEFEDHVIVDVVNRTTGAKIQYMANYVIAADGGKTFGPTLGIPFAGQRKVSDATSIHFKADLSKYWEDGDLICFIVRVGNEKDALGTSNGIFGADWSAVTQMGPTWGRKSEEFSINISFGSSHLPLESLTDDLLITHIRRTLKIPDLKIELLGKSRWHIEGVYATQYQTKRIFLAGDAVHRHPPASGLGLNTAIGDAHNVTWKIAARLKGQASSRCLQTYETERQPIGKRNSQWALFTMMHFRHLDTAVGLIPGGEELRPLNEMLYEKLCSDSFDGAIRRAAFEDSLRNQRVEFAPHDLEIGGVYTTGAFVADGTPPLPVDPRGYQYARVARPGHRLPHAWLQGAQRVSTHHLLGSDGSWLLLTDDSDGGNQWLTKAPAIGLKFKLNIKVIRIGAGPAGDFTDENGQWGTDSGLESSKGGAVLVRPDVYVAFRVAKYSDTAVAEFESACETILGLDSSGVVTISYNGGI